MPIVMTEGKAELRCVSNHAAVSMVQIETGSNSRSFACKVCGYVETYLTEEQLNNLNAMPTVEVPQ